MLTLLVFLAVHWGTVIPAGPIRLRVPRDLAISTKFFKEGFDQSQYSGTSRRL